MKVRVLVEQPARRDSPERHYLTSGEEYDLPQEWATELLGRGDAEAIAEKPAKRAERRPAAKRAEKRG